MMHRVVGLGLGLLFLIVQVGCADTNTPPPSIGDAGTGGGNEGCGDEGGPIVTIVIPQAANDPNTDEIVTDPSLTVECQVASNGAQVDGDSVAISITDAAEQTLAPSVVDNGDDTYSADVDLAGFQNGNLTVVCEASDNSTDALCSSGTVSTFLDLGPAVEIISPMDGSTQAGGMDVEFRLAPLPVSEGDTMAFLASGSLVVAGAAIPQEDWVVDGDVATAPVDFDDPDLYQTALNGTYEFTVSATNGRGVTRRETYTFTVDAGGPNINIISPQLASIISGATNVIAEITDPSGVAESTVRFRIDAEEFSMERVPGTDQYIGSFDANQYPWTIGQVTINVTAADEEGNDRTQSVSVQLDSQPPVLDMDPPVVREAQEEEGQIICSTEFDPVGGPADPMDGLESANDETVLGPVPRFRLRAEDRTNRVSAIFGIDDNDVQVYILDDHTQDLLIDTDGDTVCDAINPAFLPNNPAGNQPAVVIDMTPVAPTGTSFYPSDIVYPPAYAGRCEATGDADSPPDEVCITTYLTRVIPDNTDPNGGRPGIFGRAPLTSLMCIGDRFDFPGAGINPGYACVAARASDMGGNESVSAPLRVCLDDLIGERDCDGASIGSTFTANFDCSDGCTYDALNFPPNELIGPFIGSQ